MKYLFFILVSIPAFAGQEADLADSIAEFCDFQTENSDESKIECGLYLTNCIIGPGGDWDDKRLFKCIKQWGERNKEK